LCFLANFFVVSHIFDSVVVFLTQGVIALWHMPPELAAAA